MPKPVFSLVIHSHDDGYGPYSMEQVAGMLREVAACILAQTEAPDSILGLGIIQYRGEDAGYWLFH